MSPFTKQRLQGGLAGIGVMLLLLLLIAAHQQQQSPRDGNHAPTSFSAAGDWTVSPTARNLLGTGCQCNVQIVGGFNGSKGDTGATGEFIAGTELPNAKIPDANLSGTVTGGATYSGITLAGSSVSTSLDFREQTTDAGAPQYVKIGAPTDVSASYTIRLPDAKGLPGTFLQVATNAGDASATTWSNTLTAATILGGSVSGATARQFRVRDAIFTASAEPTVCMASSQDTIEEPGSTPVDPLMTIVGTCSLDLVAHRGAIVHWDDGSSSRLVHALDATRAFINEFESPAPLTRPAQTVRIYRADQSFSASRVHTTMHTPTMYEATVEEDVPVTRSVKLSLAPMAAGATATWQFPPIAAAGTDTLIGAGTEQTLARKTLVSPIASGSILTGRINGVPCVGSTIETRLTMRVPSRSDGQYGFGWHDIGSLLRWADGTESVIVDASHKKADGSWAPAPDGTRWNELGRVNDPAVRTNMACVFYEATASSIASDSHLSSPGPLMLHSPQSTITVSNEKVGSRVKMTWFFPPYGDGARRNTSFVGDDWPQTLTQKTIEGATLTGVTALASGATKVALSVGNTTVGSTATWSFPQTDATNADTFVGASTPQTLANKRLESIVITGQTRANGALIATTIEPNKCGASSTGGVLTIVNAVGCQFSVRSVGGVVYWSNGQTSLIVQFISTLTAAITELDSPDDPPPNIDRAMDTAVRFHWASKSFSASRLHTNMHAPRIHVDGRAVKFSMDLMANASAATWSFPSPGSGVTDTFVGASATQRLTYKTLEGATLNGTTAVIGSIAVRETAGASTGTTVSPVGITFPAPAAPSIPLTLGVFATASFTLRSMAFGDGITSGGACDVTFVRMGRMVTASFANCHAKITVQSDAIVFTTTSGASLVVPPLYQPVRLETTVIQVFTDKSQDMTYSAGTMVVSPSGTITVRRFNGEIWALNSPDAGFVSWSYTYLTS